MLQMTTVGGLEWLNGPLSMVKLRSKRWEGENRQKSAGVSQPVASRVHTNGVVCFDGETMESLEELSRAR